MTILNYDHSPIYLSQLVAVELQVARTDDPQDSNIAASAQYSHMKRSKGSRLPWAPEIAESDMAYAWSKCLAPVYAFNLIGLRAACKYRVQPLASHSATFSHINCLVLLSAICCKCLQLQLPFMLQAALLQPATTQFSHTVSTLCCSCKRSGSMQWHEGMLAAPQVYHLPKGCA